MSRLLRVIADCGHHVTHRDKNMGRQNTDAYVGNPLSAVRMGCAEETAVYGNEILQTRELFTTKHGEAVTKDESEEQSNRTERIPCYGNLWMDWSL